MSHDNSEQPEQKNQGAKRPKRYYEPTRTVAFKVTESEYELIKKAIEFRNNSGYTSSSAFRDLFMPLLLACMKDPDSEDVFDLNQTG